MRSLLVRAYFIGISSHHNSLYALQDLVMWLLSIRGSAKSFDFFKHAVGGSKVTRNSHGGWTQLSACLHMDCRAEVR